MQNFNLLFFEQVFKCSSPSAKEKPSQSGYSFFPEKLKNLQTHATAALTGNGKSLNILKHGWVLPLCPSAVCWNTSISSKEIPQVKSARKKTLLDVYTAAIHFFLDRAQDYSFWNYFNETDFPNRNHSKRTISYFY